MDQFKGTLPYASELFGIYQPLLGWKSKITAERYEAGVAKLYDAVGNKFLKAAASQVQVRRRRLPRGREPWRVRGREPRAVAPSRGAAPARGRCDSERHRAVDRRGVREPSARQLGGRVDVRPRQRASRDAAADPPGPGGAQAPSGRQDLRRDLRRRPRWRSRPRAGSHCALRQGGANAPATSSFSRSTRRAP